MGMVFCRGCGKEIHDSAPTCPHCGAPQGVKNGNSGIAAGEPIPDGVKGWSWGAFWLSWIWAIGNNTWIGLLALIPWAWAIGNMTLAINPIVSLVSPVMAIVLGIKGREWAWKNKQWENLEHFNRVQKKWSFWGWMIFPGVFLIGIIAAIAIPAYQGYQQRAQERTQEAAALQQQRTEELAAAQQQADVEPEPASNQSGDSASSQAKCEDGANAIFSCVTITGKRIEVCDAGGSIRYSYGKPQETPEITVEVLRSQASTSQWEGVGRYESYAIDIPNGNTIYSVFWGVDRLTESHPVEAGVNVLINNKIGATVNCSGGNIVNNLAGVDLKPSE